MSIYRQKPSYSTRPSAWQRVAKLLLILLFLAGLASALFLFFFRGYVVNTPSGPRLELPFLLKTQSSTAAGKQEAASAVFGANTITLPDAETTPLLSPLHAIRLSEDSMRNGKAEEEMKRAGANAVMVEMRGADGSLHYISKLKTAIDSGASSASPGINEDIQTMNRNPALYTIALVSCFSDSYLGNVQPELCLQREAGVPWRDQQNMTWLSPSKDATQTYLLDICRELADLGFDEILFTNCAYPTQGARSQQFEGSDSVETLSLTLNDFYQEARRALKEKGVSLSLRWEESPENEAKKPLSGQSLEDILPLADRVFLDGSGDHVREVFSSRGLSSSNLSLIPIQSEPGSASSSWAVLSETSKS